MNIRNLIEKLNSLEISVTEDEAKDLAAFQRGQAAQDRLNAIQQIKKMASTPLNQIGRLGDAIDPKTGIIYYGAAGMDGTTGTATRYPFKWFQSTGPGETQQLGKLIKTAGLEVVPHEEKNIFGSVVQYAKVDPEKLANIDSLSASANKADGPDISEKLAKLKELITKYQTASTAPAQSGGVAAKPAQSTPQKPINITQNQDGSFSLVKKDGSKITFDKDGKVLKEEQLSMSDMLILEMNEAEASVAQYGGAAGAGATKAALAKAGAKTVAKAIPGVGSTLSAVDAYNRWKAGDRSGAVISALAGVGWLVPGPLGWAIGGGLDAANIGRDLKKGDQPPESGVAGKPADATPAPAATPPAASATPAPAAPAPAAAKPADPKIVALQKYLKSQGADLGTTGPNKDGIDGIAGPLTRGAMQKLNLSESQKMEILRLQLEAIDDNVQLDEKGGAIVKGFSYADDVYKYGRDVANNLWKKGKEFVQGVKSPNVTPLPNAGKATNVRYKGPSTAFQAGQKVGQNPVKTAAATIGAGGVAGYMAGDDGSGDVAAKPAEPTTPTTTAADFQRTDKDTTPVATPSTSPKPATSAPASPAPAASASTTPGADLESLKKQIAQLTGEIKGSGVKNQDVDSVIGQAEEILQMTVAPIK